MSADGRRFIRRAGRVSLAVALCLVIALSLPPVQLRLVRALIGAAQQSGIALGYISVGLGGVELRDLHVATPAFAATVARAAVDLAFWSSLTHLRVDVERAALSGVDVRAVAAPLAPTAETESRAERSPFTGLRAYAKVPGWLRVRGLDAAGTATLMPNPDVAIAGPWELSVRDISAGAAASARFTATLDTRRVGDLVATSVLAIDATADVRPDLQITRLALAADARPIGADAGLRATASADLALDAERYVFDLTGRTGAQVAHAEAALSSDGRVEGRWEANLTPGIVAAFARGRSVADLSGGSTGEIRTDLGTRRVEIRSATRVQGQGWEAFDPRLAGLGTLDFELDVDAAVAPGEIAANAVRAAIRSAQRGDLLTVSTLQPLRFGTESWLVEAERVGEPALRLQLHDLPLRWIRRLVPAAKIDAGQVSGALDIVREDGRTSLRVTEPLKATGVTLAAVGVPPFDLTLTPHVSLGGGALAAEIEELTLTVPSTGGRILFHGRSSTSRAEWPVVSFDGDVAARLPRVQALVPELADVRATTELSLDFSTLTLALASATVRAEASDGRELVGAELKGEQPLRVALPGLAVDWDGFDPQSLTLRLDRLPIAGLSPYLPEIDFRSGDVSGQFTAVARRGEGVRFETGEPLVVANLLPVYRGRVAREALTATVRPALRLANTGSSLQLRELRFSTPNGNRLDGEITVDMPAGRDRVAVSVALDGDFAPFARRYGAQIGRMRWRQSAELEKSSGRLNVTELELRFEDVAGSRFFELTNLRPFYVTSEPTAVGVDGGGSPRILHATVTPLRLEGLLPNIFGFDLEGVLPEGEFFGTAEPDGRLTLAAEEPLVFRDVTVRWGDATLLDRVTMSVLYDVSYAADGFQARSVDLRAAAPDGRELLRTSSRVVAPLRDDRLVDSAQISLQANLEPLNEQPILASMPRFTAGTLEASLDFVNEGEATLAFGAKIQSAALATVGPLPNLDVRLDASGVRGDRLRVTLPLRLESASGGVSDLQFDGRVARRTDGALDFDATLAGSRVVMRDVRQLLDLLVPSESATATAARDAVPATREERATAIAKLRSQRHSVPAWTGRLLGSARVDIASIEFPSVAVQGLRGTLEVTPERVALRELRASLLGATLQAGATIDFDAARAKPYGLDFHAAIADLEVQRLFTAIAPDAPPTAEGRFELQTALTGSGLNPIDLGLSSLGEIRLTGSNGVFRGLAAQAGTGSTAARAIGILTFSRELKAIGRLLDGLGEIRFQQADIRLDRKTLDRIDLSVFSLVSPQLRVDASGSLEVVSQQPLLTSPLEVSAQLAARGDIAIVFDGMGLLEKKVGATGYRELTRRVDIRGTPAEPDASAFWELLDEGASNARGSFGVGLRALNSRLERAPTP